MDQSIPIRFVIAGQLRRDYRLPPEGGPVLDAPGGSLYYATSGLAIWESGIGMVGRVSPDYPVEWIKRLQNYHLDTRGIHPVVEPVDMRFFCVYDDTGAAQNENPVGAFARSGHPFPKELLDYNFYLPGMDSRTRLSPLSTRLADIPSDYLDAAAAHICPMDYLAHSLLPPGLRQGHITTITLDPSAGYMNPIFWDDIPPILNGLTAFLTSEEKITNLFHGRSTDLWEMAETLSSYGCELIVIKRGPRGQYLFDGETRSRWVIPAYPGRVIDPTGAGDAFCGGFLAGWRSSYSPLQAALQGNISASLVMESSSAFYGLDVMNGLAQARMQALQDRVRTV